MAKKRPAHGGKRPTPCPATRQDLEELFDAVYLLIHPLQIKLVKISAYVAAIASAQSQLLKAQGEITAEISNLKDQVATLTDQLKDVEIPDGAQDTLTALQATVENLDALNPDATTPPDDGGETPPADGGDEGDGGETTPPVEPQTLGARRAAKAKK